jgi:predicted O-methyltransferase YrrM
MTSTTLPKHYKAIQQKSRELGFGQLSEDEVGVLLRLLVSSKPFAKVLELGTGTGMGLAWLAKGLHPQGRLITVEKNKTLIDVAREFFNEDERIEFVNLDAAEWIAANKGERFDLIFADTWAGKFTDLKAVLTMVKPNGFYLIDDLNYQAHWPGYHQEKVLFLVEKLKYHPDFYTFPIDVGSGLMLLCRK